MISRRLKSCKFLKISQIDRREVIQYQKMSDIGLPNLSKFSVLQITIGIAVYGRCLCLPFWVIEPI